MSAKPTTLDLDKLPDDPALLKSLVTDLVGVLKDKEERIDKLSHQLREALRRHYGRKAETLSPDQIELFLRQIEDKLGASPQAVAPAVVAAKPIGHGRRKPPMALPCIPSHHPLPEADKACADCGGQLHKIGEESRTLIDYIPSSIVRREQTCEKGACSSCQDKVVTSELPPQAIERCLAGEGLLAQVVVSKYADHLPQYRQSEIFGRQGFEVNRSTLCHWTAQVADLVGPIHAAMKAELLESKVVHSDDTPVPVLEDQGQGPPGDDAADDPQGRRQARLGRLWVWVGDKDHPHTVFDYTPDRKGEGPLAFLGTWKGYLQADAYAGYDALYEKRGVVEVACWAHTRRKFFEAKATDKVRCLEAMAYIHKLYEVERMAKGEEAAKRRALRQEHSKPVLEAFKAWLDAQALVVLPKSALGGAIGYALRQWKALVVYVEDGDLAIDNNPAENALRCVALGRKNWLFAGSNAGGRRAAVLYSLMASCKRRGINPFEYLKDVLERLATHPTGPIRDLLPAYWKPRSPQPVAA